MLSTSSVIDSTFSIMFICSVNGGSGIIALRASFVLSLGIFTP